ncbi:MAG: hypothetical protein EPN21_20420 [Methylococcaceae bacterium]|nr:MAG: hypothetical protein EPN21_20420 [Methylococcaceae bacterium]
MKSHRCRTRRHADPIKVLCRLACCLGMLGATLSHAATATLELSVEGAGGGRIVSAGGVQCPASCAVAAQEQALVSLFAVADSGYRFDSWQGACEAAIGPLCTLAATPGTVISARFVQDHVEQGQTKALLLLHGANANYAAWNEFVKQRFNDRCPIIRGGVVLGGDSFDPGNGVYCYRIDFGYYATAPKAAAARAQDDAATLKQLGHEVRAAVLGILGRHPKLSLVLLGHDRGGQAAREFLLSNAQERGTVAGLLTIDTRQAAPGQDQGAPLPAVERLQYAQFEVVLESSGQAAAPWEPGSAPIAYGALSYKTPAVKAGAGDGVGAPEKEANISLVLGLLMNTWWLER